MTGNYNEGGAATMDPEIQAGVAPHLRHGQQPQATPWNQGFDQVASMLRQATPHNVQPIAIALIGLSLGLLIGGINQGSANIWAGDPGQGKQPPPAGSNPNQASGYTANSQTGNRF